MASVGRRSPRHGSTANNVLVSGPNSLGSQGPQGINLASGGFHLPIFAEASHSNVALLLIYDRVLESYEVDLLYAHFGQRRLCCLGTANPTPAPTVSPTFHYTVYSVGIVVDLIFRHHGVMDHLRIMAVVVIRTLMSASKYAEGVLNVKGLFCPFIIINSKRNSDSICGFCERGTLNPYNTNGLVTCYKK